MKKLLFALALGLATVTSSGAIAQSQTEVSPGQVAEGRQTLATARDLANYGEAKGDALALLTAAKMMVSVPGRVLADGQSGSDGSNFDYDALLSMAEELSQGDELISRAAADVREAADANSRAICYWEWYCYWNGYCEYVWWCF